MVCCLSVARLLGRDSGLTVRCVACEAQACVCLCSCHVCVGGCVWWCGACSLGLLVWLYLGDCEATCLRQAG